MTHPAWAWYWVSAWRLLAWGMVKAGTPSERARVIRHVHLALKRAAAVGLVAVFALLAAPVQAQTAEVVIARTFVSEEGFDGAEGWASLGAVIRWRAETHHGGDLRSAAVALSPRLHARPCAVTTRLWRCGLSADLSRPRGLGATWEAPRAGGLPSRREAWAAALEAARLLLAGDLPDHCAETPHAWGSREDIRRRLTAGERWIDAGCPGANRFGRRLVRS